jgi:ABC-type transport system involved in multi-copper enzyme maturation permease subunit
VARVATALRCEWIKVARLRFPWVTLCLLALAVVGLTEALLRTGVQSSGFYVLVFVTQSALGTLGDAFLLAFAASLVSREGATGTVRTVLVTPLSRGEFLLGKLGVVVWYSVAMLLVIFIAATGTLFAEGKLALRGGNHASMWMAVTWGYLLTVIALVARGSFALFLSACTDNLLVSIGAAFAGVLALDVVKIWLDIEWYVFTSGVSKVWAPVLDFVSGYGFSGGIPWVRIMLLCGISTVVFCVAAWGVLLRRDFHG